MVTRKSRSLVTRSAELAFVVPQVMAQRMARMATAAPVLSARDRKEFALMSSEKLTAFADSWSAMAREAFRVQQSLGMSLLRACWSPWLGGGASTRLGRQMQGAALGILNKGIAPVHRKATANAKRLRR